MRSTQPTPPPRKRGAVHDEGIELHFAVAIEKAAAPGVESLVIFHDDDSFFDRIERRAAALKHPPTRSHGIAHAIEMGFDHVVGNGPGAAMNNQNGFAGKGSPQSDWLG